jgi:cobyrinic acid a,c-diamide synthase
MVAGARSGDVKTAVALALVDALRRARLRTGVAKAGPDYLDARLFGAAVERLFFTLDPVLTGSDGSVLSLALAARGANVVVVQGVMGLRNGSLRTVGPGSSTELVRRLGGGVVLVLDASGRAPSLGQRRRVSP